MDTMRLIGMVVRRGSRWILTYTSTEKPPEGREAEDEESNSESSLASVTEPIGSSSSAVVHPRQ